LCVARYGRAGGGRGGAPPVAGPLALVRARGVNACLPRAVDVDEVRRVAALVVLDRDRNAPRPAGGAVRASGGLGVVDRASVLVADHDAMVALLGGLHGSVHAAPRGVGLAA